MRRDFWKGIIAGGIIGAIVNIVAGKRSKLHNKDKEDLFAKDERTIK